MEFEKLQQIIAEVLNIDADEITMNTTFVDDLGADSLASVELVMALEEASGITIDDEDVAGLKTVGDIVAYLKDHKA